MEYPPETFSALVQLAVDDLEKCEVDPRYVVFMGSCSPHWMVSAQAGQLQCYVSLAGCVMAKTLGMPIRTNRGHIPGSCWSAALYFLDRIHDPADSLTMLSMLRSSDLYGPQLKVLMRQRIWLELLVGLEDLIFGLADERLDYAKRPLEFKQYLRDVAKCFAAHGL